MPGYPNFLKCDLLTIGITQYRLAGCRTEMKSRKRGIFPIYNRIRPFLPESFRNAPTCNIPALYTRPNPLFRSAEEAFREKLLDEAAAEGLEIEGNQSRYDQNEEEEQDKETFDDWAERIAEEYERKRKVYAQYWGHTKHAPKRTATGIIFNIIYRLMTHEF